MPAPGKSDSKSASGRGCRAFCNSGILAVAAQGLHRTDSSALSFTSHQSSSSSSNPPLSRTSTEFRDHSVSFRSYRCSNGKSLYYEIGLAWRTLSAPLSDCESADNLESLDFDFILPRQGSTTPHPCRMPLHQGAATPQAALMKSLRYCLKLEQVTIMPGIDA